MKNDDLFPLKIDIQAIDDRKFLELATLFDKPKFLRYLPKIREKYHFDQLISIDKYHDTWNQLSDSEDKGKFNPSTYDQDNIQEIVDYAKKNDTWYFSWEAVDPKIRTSLTSFSSSNSAVFLPIF